MTSLSSEKVRESYYRIPLGFDYQQIGSGAPFARTDYGDSIFRATERLILGNGPARYRNRDGSYRYSGQVFETSTCQLELFPAHFKENFLYNASLNWRMIGEGNFIPSIGQSPTTQFNGLSADFIQTEAWGTRGWHRYAPGSSEAQMGQFLAELREIPTIPRTLKNLRRGVRNHARDFGKDYLNAQFGWAPFLSDLRKFVETTRRKDEILAQLARDNGRPIRRKGPIHSDTTTSEVVTTGSGYPPGLHPPINALFFTGPWKKTVVQTLTTEYWFSARFRYYIPDIGTPEWNARALRRLYGVDVTPSLVYNLIPWTWALDWHTNIGDTFANFSGSLAENLTADYAYVMEHRRIVTETRYEFVTVSGPKSCAIKMTQESKYRLPASPFGFGVTWDGFTPKQVAIMAALGISRS